jgi:hypothetical protein
MYWFRAVGHVRKNKEMKEEEEVIRVDGDLVIDDKKHRYYICLIHWQKIKRLFSSDVRHSFHCAFLSHSKLQGVLLFSMLLRRVFQRW